MDWLTPIADPIRLHILVSLSGVEEATAGDLARLGNVSGPAVRRHLVSLVALGLLEERPGATDGRTPGRPAASFALVPAVRRGLRSAMKQTPRLTPT